MRRIRLFFQLGMESFLMAANALWVNKLRSVLSLAGISIGIFCIVLVWTFVDSMEANINQAFEGMGQNVVYIQKWPWEFSNDYPWWKYMNRPRTNYRESLLLQERLRETPGIEEVGFMFRFYGRSIKAGGNSLDHISGLGVGSEYERINKVDIEYGRFITESEARLGSNVIILGQKLAVDLFGKPDVTGKEVQLFGRKLTVIGVMEMQGKSLLGSSADNSVFVPYQLVRKVTNTRWGGEPSILVKMSQDMSPEQMEMSIRGTMRSIRRLKPRDDDNFAMNKITMLTNVIKGVSGAMNVGGGIIGIFSILVGGFGIANIMFVSVRERTNQIGIQKALGATRGFILFQFLIESIMLSLFGGLIGVMFVVIAAWALTSAMDIEVFLSSWNFLLSNLISGGIGLLAGLIPAIFAAWMDPVEAIRSK